ncbi:MAG: glycogen debranching protein GlgX [Solirubrobacteraceae bacterium]
MSDLRPGRPFPLGATWDGAGTNFSLWSEAAQRVELCLFGEDGKERRVEVRDRIAFQWHIYVRGVGPGQRYGYRVHGPYDPAKGVRFNPAKLLIDPYAKAIEGGVDWHAANALPYQPGGGEGADLQIDDADDAAAIPKSVVIDPGFDWGGDRLLGRSWSATVIYETHVKGFTMRHPNVPQALRGTYAGLGCEPATAYLQSLGVTAVELLPVHHIIDESFLIDRRLSNYWGYSSIGYFAPHSAYSSSGARGEQLQEFKQMVKSLHSAGIEVILDVVFNHTAEGNHLGPMLAFKGVDNAGYYRLSPEDPRYYMDFTGTGNTLNTVNPAVLRMIMDSLRYFVLDCHVDGFRFDLAAALARELYDVDRLGSFFDVIYQDPFLSRVKLIAEPWDVGPGGYQVGNFPVLWSEWNGQYRDGIRDFWRGEAPISQLAQRLTGSADLYGSDGRRPFASINFITAHDGFTLADLVSYNDKHNEANLEDNRDGTDDNRSWNCGVEGPTDDPEVIALRARQQRNLLTTLLLSHGVPMLLGGDELGRSQAGNNNAWCQDNELSWYDWESIDHGLLELVRRLIQIRQTEPVFRRRDFLVGEEATRSGLPDVLWMRPDGGQVTDEDWGRRDARAIGVFLNGQEIPSHDRNGNPIRGASFLLLFNAGPEPVTFAIPKVLGRKWSFELTTDPGSERGLRRRRANLPVASRSIVVLRQIARDTDSGPEPRAPAQE